MKLISVRSGALVSIGVAWALALLITGCDSTPNQAAETKPIKSNILKKLSESNAAQSQEASSKKAVRAKTK
jgi:hypothetical protein